ncbi:MAG: hypothetical protein K6A68_16860 [Clostridiales bacterium]|nr:hypothetical protein [Clostridiales bacterium]
MIDGFRYYVFNLITSVIDSRIFIISFLVVCGIASAYAAGSSAATAATARTAASAAVTSGANPASQGNACYEQQSQHADDVAHIIHDPLHMVPFSVLSNGYCQLQAM